MLANVGPRCLPATLKFSGNVLLQAALQLTEEQVAHMVRARREFLASLKALLQQRRALGDIICASITKDCNSNPAVSTQHSKVCTSHNSNSQAWSAVHSIQANA
jgi:hypothetical protein